MCCGGTRGRTRTGTDIAVHKILSLACLPISPPGQRFHKGREPHPISQPLFIDVESERLGLYTGPGYGIYMGKLCYPEHDFF